MTVSVVVGGLIYELAACDLCGRREVPGALTEVRHLGTADAVDGVTAYAFRFECEPGWFRRSYRPGRYVDFWADLDVCPGTCSDLDRALRDDQVDIGVFLSGPVRLASGKVLGA